MITSICSHLYQFDDAPLCVYRKKSIDASMLKSSTCKFYNWHVHCTLYNDSTNNISFRQKTVTWRLQIISGSYFHFMGQDAQDYNKLKYHFDIVKWTMYMLNYITQLLTSAKLTIFVNPYDYPFWYTVHIMNLNFPQKTNLYVQV